MQSDTYHAMQTLLASTKPEDLRRGLELVKKEISRVGSDEARPLFEMISTIFYVDPLDRPDLVPVLEEAIGLVVGFGKWVIPALIQQLEGGDLKAEIAVSHALGRMGADAIGPLMAEYQSTSDAGCRQFILYALGKVKSPRIVQAVQIALDAALSSDRELRDTATRTIGKFVESIPAAQLPDDVRAGFVAVLRTNAADRSPTIRAKAVRSLGKLAKYDHLRAEERTQLKATLEGMLGRDERFEWDRAYLVRREAEEALRYL
jgi:HEAT repeat protein